MKKILFSLLILSALNVKAQTDSANQANTWAVQVRDAAFLIGSGILHPSDTLYKVAYDSISAKLNREANKTSGNTNNLNIPIRPKAILKLSENIRAMDIRFVSTMYSRLNTGFRGITGTGNIGRAWLIIRLDALDSGEAAETNTIILRAFDKVAGEKL
jgi:hypothetical protein